MKGEPTKMGHQGRIQDSDVIDGLSIRFLKISGMWKAINDYRTTGKKSIVIKIHILGSLLISIPYVICQVESFFKTKYDIQKFTLVSIHPMPALQMCCRILLFWLQMDRFCRLSELMAKDFITIPEYLRENVKDLYVKRNRTCNLICLAAIAWNIIAELIYIFFPSTPVDYIKYHIGSMSAVKTGKNKLLAGWYPVPMGESPYYEIIYVYEAFCMLWTGTMLSIYICMFYQVLTCLCAQFTALGCRVSNLKIHLSDGGLNRAGEKRVRKFNNRIYEEIYQSLKDHQNLLSYTDELRKFYNPLVTITLGIGILLLMLGANQILIGKAADPSFFVQLFDLISFQFIEVSLLCFGSSSIQAASSDLQFAIYCSDWYRADTKFRKAAQMLMIRTRRSSTLTAIVMYPVNMETLGAIAQFTYSAAALMSGMIG